MGGWLLVHGRCCACGLVIAFNPDRVPSLRVNGHREPLCVACFHRWNELHRVAKGLEPLELHPEAYELAPA